MLFTTKPRLRHGGLHAAALLGLFAGCSQAPSDGHRPDVGSQQRGLLAVTAPPRLHAEAAGGYASSVDERGVPTFIWAARVPMAPAGLDHGGAALHYTRRFAQALALSADAVATVAPSQVYDHGDGGIVVQLRQRVGGLPIYDRELRLLMRQDHSLVALAGQLAGGLERRSGAFVYSPGAALATALGKAQGRAVAAASITALPEPGGDAFYLRVDSALSELAQRAMAHKVLAPIAGQLRPAYVVDFYTDGDERTPSEAWSYLVAADDGAVLEQHSLMQSEVFHYRVWADPKDKRPFDGPVADWTPHPSGRSDWSYPPLLVPPLVPMEGFNKNPQGKADPWLAPGAKETAGNNVDALTDRYRPEGLGGGDFRATVGGGNAFDYSYDLFAEPALTKGSAADRAQAMATTVQAFYVVNWLHDYWYDSGFNEKAGNGQLDNFERGGRGMDRLVIQTQDNYLPNPPNEPSKDNANMSTPSDGMSPRMQLFVWSGRETRRLHATPPDTDIPSSTASFGLDSFDVTGELVEIDDGTFPSPTDGCEPIRNRDKLAGKVALIDRGVCTFKRKAVNAREAGAIAVLIVNNVTGDAPRMGNGDPTNEVIPFPVLSTTKPTGAALRELLAKGPVKVRFQRTRDIDRDGGLDNLVTAHEWGHYLHHRLAACRAYAQCAAMSEGWGDFLALHTAARERDNFDGTYADSIWAGIAYDDPAYFGIRRYPYSVDFRRNPLTFKHIADSEELPDRILRNFGGSNSEVHSAGEVWAQMMWEAYVALIRAGKARKPAQSFDQVRRRMADYVVTGLQMTPKEATYTEGRDAILAAAGARDLADQQVLAEAFARRGAGTCADSPPRKSETFNGVNESFKVQPRLVVSAVELEVADAGCDKDGILDAGEKAKVTLKIANGALQPLEGATLKISTKTKGVTFTGATSFTLPKLAPFESQELISEVALAPEIAQPDTLVIKVEPSANAACDNISPDWTWKINYDVAKESKKIDDVESETIVWKSSDDAIWFRGDGDAGNHLFHAQDFEYNYDETLESPDVTVAGGQFFIIRFDHTFSFDARTATGVRSYYDGGLLELSEDGGKSWKEISQYGVNPGYSGEILKDTCVDRKCRATGLDCNDAAACNPDPTALTGKSAYVDRNFAYPKPDRVTLNFLDSLAGKTIRIRFRIVTNNSANSAEEATGWDIDNIAFQGIVNSPFTGVVNDTGKCGTGPRGGEMKVATGGCTVARSPSPAPLAPLFLLPVGVLLLRRRRS